MVIRVRRPEVPPFLRGPLVVDRTGLPRYWPTVWALLLPEGAESSLCNQLNHLDSLYQFADEVRRHGCLDDALAKQNHSLIAEILEGYFIFLKNRPSPTREDNLRWQSAVRFIQDILTRMTAAVVTNAQLNDLLAKLARFETLYGHLKIRRSRKVEPVRSLPPSAVEELYELLDPESNRNPFRKGASRWRVFVEFVMMLHLGLRRGEVLILPVDAVKSQFDPGSQRRVFWINVGFNTYEDDPRYSKAGIKTDPSIRALPLSELTANVIAEYVDTYRGRPSHSFLMNSQRNHPLSTESVTKHFNKINDTLSESVLQDLKNYTGIAGITPHALRHTCAVVRLNQLRDRGVEMDEALQQMRTFFGWSRSSEMPQRYARAYFEDSWTKIWGNIFDDRVAVLRAVPATLP